MTVGNELNDLTHIINHAISMELRVENTEVTKTVQMMEDLGFKAKLSWAAVHLPNHTVIEFWKKELMKSSADENR